MTWPGREGKVCLKGKLDICNTYKGMDMHVLLLRSRGKYAKEDRCEASFRTQQSATVFPSTLAPLGTCDAILDL